MKSLDYLRKELFKTEVDRVYGIKLSYKRLNKIIEKYLNSKELKGGIENGLHCKN